jgi:hypothetical protein
MRPNFPSQIAQRLAAPLQRGRELLRIFASCGFFVGTGWCWPPGSRRTLRRREARSWGRSGLPGLAAYRDIVRSVSLSRSASRGEAADLVASTSEIAPTRVATVALGLFGRDREHRVTCNRFFRLAVRLGEMGSLAQSYAGKHPI